MQNPVYSQFKPPWDTRNENNPALPQHSTGRQSPSVIWTPDDVTPFVDNVPIISSLGIANWEGIVVERRRVPPSEVLIAHQSHHLVVLALGEPFNYCHKIGSRNVEGKRTPGTISVIPAGLPCSLRWEGTAETLNIHLSREFVARVHDPYAAGLEGMEIVYHPPIADSQIEHIGRALLAELEQGVPGGRLFGESLATALAVRLLSRYSESPIVPSLIKGKLVRSELRRVLDYIQNNLQNDLSLTELAGVAGVSTNYFAAMFKQAAGMSPHQYVIHQRIEKSKPLLRGGDLSIGEIAFLVGFYDSSHFIRHFKRLTGFTPKSAQKRS